MPWNKAQGQIDRMHIALRSWKEAFEEYQAELKRDRQSKTGGVSILQITHDRFTDQGRAAVLALADSKEAR